MGGVAGAQSMLKRLFGSGRMCVRGEWVNARLRTNASNQECEEESVGESKESKAAEHETRKLNERKTGGTTCIDQTQAC